PATRAVGVGTFVALAAPGRDDATAAEHRGVDEDAATGSGVGPPGAARSAVRGPPVLAVGEDRTVQPELACSDLGEAAAGGTAGRVVAAARRAELVRERRVAVGCVRVGETRQLAGVSAVAATGAVRSVHHGSGPHRAHRGLDADDLRYALAGDVDRRGCV